MNFERKKHISQNQLFPILSETQEQKFEKKNVPEVFKLESIPILAICNQTHSII